MATRLLCVTLGLGLLAGPGWGADPPADAAAIPPPVAPVPIAPPYYSPQLPDPLITYGRPLAGPNPSPLPQGPPLPLDVARRPLPQPAPVPWEPEPQMIGDVFLPEATVSRSSRVNVSIPVTGVASPGFAVQARLNTTLTEPILSTEAYKVADNEGVRPVDRVFGNFTFFNNTDLSAAPFGPANAFLPTAGTLTNFGSVVNRSTLGTTSGAINGVILLTQLANSAFAPQYNNYLQAVLNQGNFVLRQPVPDIANARTLIANASAGNFLTARNVTLLNAHTADTQIGAIVSGVFTQGGTTTLPVRNIQVQSGPFAGTNGQAVRVEQTNLYQEVFGFEKTFLDGYASIGLRAPVLQFQGDGSLGQSDFGDLSLVLKYLFLNNPDLGVLASGGMVLTLPTGPDTILAPGGSALNPTVFQPYVGGLYSTGRAYVQGFSSVAVPTDFREATLWFNDLAVGYRVYQSAVPAVFTGFTPVAEIHVNTPLNHRGFGAPNGVPDSVLFTGGCHFTLFHRTRLTVGVGGPATAPHPADMGVFTQLNVLF